MLSEHLFFADPIKQTKATKAWNSINLYFLSVSVSWALRLCMDPSMKTKHFLTQYTFQKQITMKHPFILRYNLNKCFNAHIISNADYQVQTSLVVKAKISH